MLMSLTKSIKCLQNWLRQWWWVNYKQFQLFDKTDKKSTLDGETKNFIKEIENKEKHVDKKGFKKYFSYEPIALVISLLSQNT